MTAKNQLERLDDLYQLVALSEKLGKPFPNEYLTEITDLEEQLIKTEVLPLIHDNIEPTLRRVKRPLVLVVEYDPDGALKVNLSREVNITAQIADAKEITPDPIVEHATQKASKKKKVVTQPRTPLRITMPDGRIIEDENAYESLRQFVIAVGVEKVRELGLVANKVPFVSNTVDPKYKAAQKPLPGGWYLMTCTGTGKKKQQIESIAASLHLPIHIEILEK